MGLGQGLGPGLGQGPSLGLGPGPEKYETFVKSKAPYKNSVKHSSKVKQLLAQRQQQQRG